MKISIVIPLFNEEESLPHLIKAISEVMVKEAVTYEVIFVDDGSTDGSFQVCTQLYKEYSGIIRVYRFNRNYGKSAALSVGISKADGDIIITMDADLQDDPIAIPEMIKLLNQGWDVVSGWKKKRYDPISKTLPSKFFNLLTSKVSGLEIHDFNCGFKAYKSEAAKSLEIYGQRHRYLPVLAHWNGYKVTEITVPHHARKFGKTKFGIGRANGLFDLFTLLFLRKYLKNPMHFFGQLGIFFISTGTCILGYFGIEWCVTQTMRMRPLVFLSVGAIIMGIQFLSIGLIGEMITNLLRKETYIIRENL